MKVLIVEEHPQRERLALLFLREHLARRGHASSICDTASLEQQFALSNPDVVVDNVSDSVAHYIGKWSALTERHRNVNVIWEQALNPLAAQRFRFEDLLTTQFVDGRATWGPLFAELLLRENPQMDATRVRPCGSIKHSLGSLLKNVNRTDLLRHYPELEGRWRARVLLVDGFSAADLDLEKHRRLQGSRPYLFAYEVISYLRSLRGPSISFFERVAKKNHDVQFVLRLHPSKRFAHRSEYDALRSMPNVVTVSDGDIMPLLRIVDLVVAPRSGVLLDAYSIGTPALNLALPHHVFRQSSVVCTVEEQFAATIDPTLHDRATVESLVTLASDYCAPDGLAPSLLGPLDGSAYSNIVAFIEEIAQRPSVAKRLPIRELTRSKTALRLGRNRLLLAGLARAKPTRADEFDYLSLFELLMAHDGDAVRRTV